jgi:hypothetical protein
VGSYLRKQVVLPDDLEIIFRFLFEGSGCLLESGSKREICSIQEMAFIVWPDLLSSLTRVNQVLSLAEHGSEALCQNGLHIAGQ